MNEKTSATPLALRAEGLTVRAGDFLLDAVDVEVPTGYVVGMVGPNGAGKTTTIKAILGMVGRSSGFVELFGEPASRQAARNAQIGVVLDRPFFSPDWRVASVGTRVGRFYPTWDADRFAGLLREFRLPARTSVGALSRGQGMRLSFAVALCHDPRLLILDEPTGGLDPVARAELVEGLREFMVDENHSVLFSTHITSDLDGLADFIQVLDGGHSTYRGTLDDLHAQFALVQGVGDPGRDALRAVLGLRRARDRFEGMIRVADSHLFGRDAELSAATTDDIVVHLVRAGHDNEKGL
ncbi:MAG TPA: ABC transporter ATP-binding protein [Microbacteriaceae bacterium]|nr:ABC transporter ATP-binding protein [Microbacteriaceae bacterium]